MTAQPHHRWTPVEILCAIQAWAAGHDGVPPSKAQWHRYEPHYPNTATVRRLFGTWSNAIHAAGLSPRKGHARWTDETIIEVLQPWTQEHGPPRAMDWNTATPDHPARRLVTTRFGSWEAALRAADITPRPPEHKWSRERIAAAMQAWTTTHERPPRAMEWQQGSPSNPARAHVWRQFGSWDAALQAAELETRSQPSPPLGTNLPRQETRRREA